MTNPLCTVIQSPLPSVIQNAVKNLSIITLLLISCSPYTDPSPTTERAIYPAECDYSPIELGSLKIYDTDSTFLYSIDLDHKYVPYRINLKNDTYIFKLHSGYTNQTAYYKISIHMKTTNTDLNICEGD